MRSRQPRVIRSWVTPRFSRLLRHRRAPPASGASAHHCAARSSTLRPHPSARPPPPPPPPPTGRHRPRRRRRRQTTGRAERRRRLGFRSRCMIEKEGKKGLLKTDVRKNYSIFVHVSRKCDNMLCPFLCFPYMPIPYFCCFRVISFSYENCERIKKTASLLNPGTFRFLRGHRATRKC